MLGKIKHAEGWALCVVRTVLGTIFIAHGGQKVFGLFGGPGLEGFVGWASSMGIHACLAYLAAFAELFGGLMMFLGIAAELGAALTIPVMMGAIWFVHGHSGYFMQNGGFEYQINLIFLALAIIIGGPGMGLVIWDPIEKHRR